MFLSISEQVTIHRISHMEVLVSGHVHVVGHVLERSVSMDTNYGGSVLLSLLLLGCAERRCVFVPGRGG